MLENAIRDVWRRSRSNMHEYGKNSEGLSGNLIRTYCITVTNHPISPGDLSVGSEVLHSQLYRSRDPHASVTNYSFRQDTPLCMLLWGSMIASPVIRGRVHPHV